MVWWTAECPSGLSFGILESSWLAFCRTERRVFCVVNWSADIRPDCVDELLVKAQHIRIISVIGLITWEWLFIDPISYWKNSIIIEVRMTRDLHGLVGTTDLALLCQTTVPVDHLESKTERHLDGCIQRLVDTFLVVERHWHRLIQADHEWCNVRSLPGCSGLWDLEPGVDRWTKQMYIVNKQGKQGPQIRNLIEAPGWSSGEQDWLSWVRRLLTSFRQSLQQSHPLLAVSGMKP